MTSTTPRPAATPPEPEDHRVTVVVASRNRREELLQSLARHRAPVILMDNASTDGTAEAVRRHLPHVTVVELDTNLGAYARTLGVARARTPYVAFADDDSWWAPGSLRAAADVLDAHADVGLVAARILVGASERVDTVCEVMATSPLRARPALPGPRLLGFVACAAMVRVDAFTEVGGFDDVVRFPGEEERLAWDLTARGHALVYRDDVVVHHHPSPLRHSPDARIRAMTRSGLLTALMRQPWAEIGRRVGAALRGGSVTRGGLRDALGDVPRALRRRHVLPRAVLDDLALLSGERPPADRPAADAGPPAPDRPLAQTTRRSGGAP